MKNVMRLGSWIFFSNWLRPALFKRADDRETERERVNVLEEKGNSQEDII